MAAMRRTATLLLGLLLVGCPESGSTNPNPGGATNPPPAVPAPVPSLPPPPPPARPKEGWGLVGVGSSFETVTRTHYESGALPDWERTAVETVLGLEPDGVRVSVETRQADAPVSAQEITHRFKSDAKDPDAKKPEPTHETVTVKAGTFECDVTTETTLEATTRTWRTKSLPVAVKAETKGDGYTSTAELIRADVKPPRD